MKGFARILFVLSLAVFVSCQEGALDIDCPWGSGESGFSEIVFGIDDAGTKVSALSSVPDNFNVLMTRGSAGTGETSCWNTSFSKGSDSQYYGGKYWPSSNEGYHFYASNASISYNSGNPTVSVGTINTDIICASLAYPVYEGTGAQNKLAFEHILARVGGIEEILDATGEPVDTVSLSYELEINASASGTYNLRTGSWTRSGSKKIYRYGAGGTHDDWIIPGTYGCTLGVYDLEGNYSQLSGTCTFSAGNVNNVKLRLDSGSVVVREEFIYYEPCVYFSMAQIPASGGNTTRPSYEVYQGYCIRYYCSDGTYYDSDEYEAYVDVTSVRYKYDNGAWSSSFQSKSVPSRGTTEDSDRTNQGTQYIEVTSNGETGVGSAIIYQQRNVKTTVPASDVTTAFQITLSTNTVSSAGGTVYAYGKRTYTHTDLKYTYTSGAVTGGAQTTGLVSDNLTTGFTLSGGSPLSFSGNVITVPAYTSTTADRSWTIGSTYTADGTSKAGSPAPTLTQLKVTSWSFDDDDDGNEGEESGNL